MKELHSDSKLRKKVTLTQRPRQSLKEEDGKKRPVTTEELEKIVKIDHLLDFILKLIDPFTVDSFDISSYQLKKSRNPGSEDKDANDLLKEYITEPQKQKKRFAECKKTFDLVLNQEDSDQIHLTSTRFEFYNSVLPVSSSTADKIEFLKSVPLATSAKDRKRVLEKVQRLKTDSQRVSQTQSSRLVTEKIIESDSPPSSSLSSSDKLLLLRSILKYFGDWDKIEKEFREKSVSVEALRKIWRCFKVTMIEEVAELKKKAPNFHYIKWLRTAIRKLELGTGKKNKNKHCFNLKPKEQRLDMLSIMADAENAKRFGIESSTYLNFTASSSFKVYTNENI